jgi:Tol biopolymer transport system component/predicted Ser/Thr protein kinase
VPLTPGEKLAAYEIRGLLGAGGMGEVYRAHDPRLQRDVAVKISSEQFSERFDREARAIAALNHPNICQIYDVGTNYLVMELVEGEAPQGPLPVDEVLRIADQIAAALEAAHARGVVHRDLKPANIKVTPAGVVKVLDFGLAKIGGSTPTAVTENSPTLSLAATQAGVVLGTAAYMAPEQARGKAVDHRADIWAFGVVVCELLTGERVFKGEDLTETLASVVKDQPDLDRVPRRLRRMLKACLEKDPARRLQAIGDARLLLESGDAPAESSEGTARRRLTAWLWPAVAAMLAIALGVMAWASWREVPAEQTVQFTISAPEDGAFINNFGSFAVSPDGRYVVFAARDKDGSPSLWLRPIDSLVARPLPDTTVSNFPFWSPDSKSVAFTAPREGKLKRIEITGGAALTLADLPIESAITSTGTWNRDGIILFGSSTGLQRVSASGGGVTALTSVDTSRKETGHGYPQFMPDGTRFLYFVASDDANVQGVYASSLSNPQQRTLLVRTDAKAVYVPLKGSAPPYLLWMQSDTLVAQRFNVDRMEREGDPLSLAEGIGRNQANPVRVAYWASEAGLLTYHGGDRVQSRRVVWVSRDGKALGDALPIGPMASPVLSPDGTRLALQRPFSERGAEDIGVWEFSRSVSTRLTFEPETERTPVWSPDSRQIAYSRVGKGIYRKDASGSGQPELLLESSRNDVPLDWSHDGRFLLYRAQGPPRSIWVLPLPLEGAATPQKPFRLTTSQADEPTGRFSPDGKWVAFGSNESGALEVYIQPFVPPGSANRSGGRWQVSNAGGGNVAWRGDGEELYYDTQTGDIMAVAIRAEGQGLKLDAPRPLMKALLDGSALHSFDVTRDGQRFLVQLPPAASDQNTALTVITNWQAALRK